MAPWNVTPYIMCSLNVMQGKLCFVATVQIIVFGFDENVFQITGKITVPYRHFGFPQTSHVFPQLLFQKCFQLTVVNRRMIIARLLYGTCRWCYGIGKGRPPIGSVGEIKPGGVNFIGSLHVPPYLGNNQNKMKSEPYLVIYLHFDRSPHNTLFVGEKMDLKYYTF